MDRGLGLGPDMPVQSEWLEQADPSFQDPEGPGALDCPPDCQALGQMAAMELSLYGALITLCLMQHQRSCGCYPMRVPLAELDGLDELSA